MRIIIVHPQLRNYRLRIFERLRQEYYITKFIFLLPPPEGIAMPSNWKYKILKKHDDRLQVRWMIRLITELVRDRNNFDIILTSNVFSSKSRICFFMAKILNKKFVTWDLAWGKKDSILRRVRKFFASFILRNSDSCICYGIKAKEFLLEMGVTPKKIFLSNPCTIDHSANIHIDIREKLHIKDKKVVLYLSRIIRWKGLDVLINAFKLVEERMDNAFLLIGGDGDFKGECELLSNNLKIKNIKFLGKISQNNVGIYYKSCDLFVLPSIMLRNITGTYSYEAWGFVINEAMSFSLPVITTDAVGAAFDLVKNGYNGFIVKNNNVEYLYSALMKILSNPNMAKKMGQRSREIFKEFNDYNKMFKGIDEALKYALSK